jgi:hypothetical protein
MDDLQATSLLTYMHNIIIVHVFIELPSVDGRLTAAHFTLSLLNKLGIFQLCFTESPETVNMALAQGA